MVVDSRISAAKVCDCVISGMWSRGCACYKHVSSVFSLVDCTLKNHFLTAENWV